jgi:hypothetical protein
MPGHWQAIVDLPAIGNVADMGRRTRNVGTAFHADKRSKAGDSSRRALGVIGDCTGSVSKPERLWPSAVQNYNPGHMEGYPPPLSFFTSGLAIPRATCGPLE